MSETAKAKPLFGIGGVTLLTVLLILCLTLFAVLALSFAQADLRLSEKNAGAIKAYYEAENHVYSLMAKATELWPANSSRPPASAFADALAGSIPSSADAREVSAREFDDGLVINASVRVMDESYLRVQLRMMPGEASSRWEVRQWQLIPPSPDESEIGFLPVYMP